MSARRRRLVAVLVLAPTLVLAAWAGWLGWSRAGEPAMRIAITGYDPRDLLRGNYLSFRLDLDLDGPQPPPCACLHPDPARPHQPRAVPLACTEGALASCRHPLRAPGGPQRYYLAEDQAQHFEDLLAREDAGASVLVHFRGDGAVSFSDLRAQER